MKTCTEIRARVMIPRGIQVEQTVATYVTKDSNVAITNWEYASSDNSCKVQEVRKVCLP